MDAERVAAALGLGANAVGLERLRVLGAIEPPPAPLPSGTEVERLMGLLDIAEVDRADVRAARGAVADDPAYRWLFDRCYHQLARSIGGLGEIDGWPTLPETADPAGRCLYVWVFLAAAPLVRDFHAGRGIPEPATWRVLRELGSQMANSRALSGRTGLATHSWMTGHFRGVLYRLGRLLFERQRIWFDAEPVAGETRSDRSLPRRGDWSLGVHIPGGRLTPESCDDAFAQARDFFGRHFPDEPYRFATCVSWVLDGQLAAHLDPRTNIMAFQGRFTPLPAAAGQEEPADGETVESIFRRPWPGPVGLDALPRATSLERAIVDHLRAGGHWYYRAGWLTL